jgi:hypothetical protein
MNVYINPRGGVEEDYPLHAHTRDFLDKLKAKNRKTNAPMEVGYNSALPALLALEAMKDNKVLGWDPVAKIAKTNLRYRGCSPFGGFARTPAFDRRRL